MNLWTYELMRQPVGFRVIYFTYSENKKILAIWHNFGNYTSGLTDEFFEKSKFLYSVTRKFEWVRMKAPFTPTHE